jgi:hypothetical protein
MTGMSSGRPPFVTIGYDEQPLDGCAADIHPATPLDGPYAEPEITLGEVRPGFETMAIIDEELAREPRSRTTGETSYVDAEVLELFTFVILDRSLSSAATDSEKRAFVEQRLWHRLPPGGMISVKRIDMRPVDESALMIRVWVAVSHARL